MKRKQGKHMRSTVMGIGLSVTIGCALNLIAAALLAILITNGTISEAAAGIWVALVHACAAFFVSLISGKLIGKRYLIICMLSTMLYCAVLIGSTILIFDTRFAGIGKGLVTSGLGGVAGWVMCTLKVGQRRRVKIAQL